MRTVFELGLNHLGDLSRAKRMVGTLAAQGAESMTIQVIVEPARFTRVADAIRFLEKNALTLEDNLAAIRHAVSLGIKAGATVVEPDHIPPLFDAGARFFKILSADFTYDPLRRRAAATGLPVYVSTGASDMADIGRAVALMRTESASSDVRLIHTVLSVPTPAALLNLRCIPVMASAFQTPVAYGQHSADRQAMLTAVAAGAESLFVYVAEERVEKLPDGPHAVLCSEAGELLRQVHLVETMLGSTGPKGISAEERVVQPEVRRSIVAARAIAAGTRIAPNDIAFKRPASGLAPEALHQVLGLVADRDYHPDDDLVCGAPATPGGFTQ